MMLPCRHIFAVSRFYAMSVYDPSICSERWTLSYFKASHHLFNNAADLQNDISSSDSVSMDITLLTPDHDKILSEQQKFRKTQAVAMSLAQIISEQGMEDFKYNLAILTSLQDHLNARRKVIIITDIDETSCSIPFS